MKKRPVQYILAGLAVLFLIIQVMPSEAADNPPVEEEIVAPAEVMEVLRGSCYDCHSFRTDWPWYSHVAPMKWLVRDHVADGRSELNFTAWNRLGAEDRPHKLEEVAEEVEEGEMPKRSYLLLHRDARLTDAERQLLIDWAMSESLRLERAPAAEPTPEELLELDAGSDR